MILTIRKIKTYSNFHAPAKVSKFYSRKIKKYIHINNLTKPFKAKLDHASTFDWCNFKHALKFVCAFFAITATTTPSALSQFKVGIGNKTQENDDKQLINYANPKDYKIAGISVVGTKYLDPNTLISVSGLALNDVVTIPSEKIATAIRRLMAQGIIEDVAVNITKIEGSKVYLELNLRERPRLSKMILKGIRKSEIESVDEKIKSYKGKVITDAMVKNIQGLIRKHFQDKGFYYTAIQVAQTLDSLRPNNATLTFNVDKNHKVKVNEIKLIGVEKIPTWKALSKMKGTKAKAPLRIFTPSKFVARKYKEDKEKLIDFLNKSGFRNAQIKYDSVKKRNDGNLDVVLHLHEGNKFYYRNISWSGNYLRNADTLNLILGIKKGDLYNPEDLNKRLNGKPQNDVSSYYMDDGYLYFSVTPVEKQIVGDSIDVEFRIFEGKQATINKVIVNGNTKTSDHVVYRELLTKPGQKFSKTDLIESVQILSKLGYFNPEKLNPVPRPNPDGTVDIVYTVEEKSNDQIELSGGWGGVQRFIGTFGIVFNNFSIRKANKFREYRPLPKGDGQKFAFRLQANGGFQSYSLSFTEPWLGGKKPNSFSVSLFHSVQDYGKLSKQYEKTYGSGFGNSLYSNGYFRNTGASISFGKRLSWPDRNFSFSTSLSYQFYNVFNYPIIPNFLKGRAHDLAFGLNISRYSLDNPQFTRSGSNVSLGITLNPPYSALGYQAKDPERLWIEAHKWMFDADWYTPIVGKFVFHAKGNLGFIGRYDKNTDFTPFGRFSLGGAGLGLQGSQSIGQEYIGLRGYEDGVVYVPSLAEKATAFSNAINGRTGGLIYNKFTAEVRYPVSLNPSAIIYVLGFAEAGNSWGAYKSYNPFQLRRVTGVGARIFMAAFGLIGIDYGYAFDKIPGLPNQGQKQFTFSIGNQIR